MISLKHLLLENEESKKIELDLTNLYKKYLTTLKKLQGTNGIEQKLSDIRASTGFDWNKQQNNPEIQKLNSDKEVVMKELSGISQQLQQNFKKMKDMGLEDRANIKSKKRKEKVLKISNNWTKNSVSDIQRNQKNKMSDMEKGLSQKRSDLEKSLAQKRQVYKDELNAWYKNGQKGPQPQLSS
jgi:hypothetical protein